MQTVEDLGEDRLLERIARLVDSVRTGVLGMGDDAAVLRTKAGSAVLTTDTLVENVHFRRHWFTPEDLGWKALAANLSDVAAMGARPVAALVSLILPRETPVSAVLGFYKGMRPLARRSGVDLLGGNLARGSTLSLTLTVLGRLQKEKPIFRSGARPGDRLLVSGQPGLARLGCMILDHGLRRGLGKDPWSQPRSRLVRRRKRVQEILPGSQVAIRRFLRPEPRLDLIRDVRRLRATALMDVSDGLAADLPRLAKASGVGILVHPKALPETRTFRRLCEAFHMSPERLVLEGGEDYELLMTVPKSTPLPNAWHCIGEVTSGDQVLIQDANGRARPLREQGFDHFMRS